MFAVLMDSADDAVNFILDCERRFDPYTSVLDVVDESVLQEAYVAAKGNCDTVAVMLGFQRRQVSSAYKMMQLNQLRRMQVGSGCLNIDDMGLVTCLDGSSRLS